MKKDSSSKIIEDYYNEIKNEYDISYEEFKLICTSPFKMLKESLNKHEFVDFRFKYLGTFTVSKNRIKYSLKSLDKKLSKGTISNKMYEERKKQLENGLQE